MGTTASVDADFQRMVQASLAEVFESQIYTQYTSVIAATWFAWDWAITFDREIKCIWCSPGWTLMKTLYLVIRYGVLTSYPLLLYVIFTNFESPHLCGIARFGTALFVFLGHAVQLVLCLRVWALYNRSKRIAVFLAICWLVVVGVTVSIIVKYLGSSRILLPPLAPSSPKLFGCLLNPVSGYYGGMVASLIAETIILLMTIYKVLQHSRKEFKSPLFSHLLTSGFAFYAAMFGIILLNILTKPFPVLSVPILSSSALLIVQGLACCRIVLALLAVPAKVAEGEASEGFLTIPTGLYTKEWPEAFDPDDDELTRYAGSRVDLEITQTRDSASVSQV